MSKTALRFPKVKRAGGEDDQSTASVGQVLTAVTMKTSIFWDMTPCSLVDRYRRFKGTCCF
jgi:hypothetical protein